MSEAGYFELDFYFFWRCGFDDVVVAAGSEEFLDRGEGGIRGEAYDPGEREVGWVTQGSDFFAEIDPAFVSEVDIQEDNVGSWSGQGAAYFFFSVLGASAKQTVPVQGGCDSREQGKGDWVVVHYHDARAVCSWEDVLFFEHQCGILEKQRVGKLKKSSLGEKGTKKLIPGGLAPPRYQVVGCFARPYIAGPASLAGALALAGPKLEARAAGTLNLGLLSSLPTFS